MTPIPGNENSGALTTSNIVPYTPKPEHQVFLMSWLANDNEFSSGIVTFVCDRKGMVETMIFPPTESEQERVPKFCGGPGNDRFMH